MVHGIAGRGSYPLGDIRSLLITPPAAAMPRVPQEWDHGYRGIPLQGATSRCCFWAAAHVAGAERFGYPTLHPRKGIMVALTFYAVPQASLPTRFTVRETTAGTSPKPRLLDRVRTALRARHYSRRTEDALRRSAYPVAEF